MKPKYLISENLEQVKWWGDANGLLWNYNKTQILGFNWNIEDIDGESFIIQSFTNTKFIELHLDTDLNFHSHSIDLNKKLSSGRYCMREMPKNLNISNARSVASFLWTSILRPLFTISLPIHLPTLKTCISVQGQYFIIYNTIKLYNHLPAIVKTIISQKFPKDLKDIQLKQAQSIEELN